MLKQASSPADILKDLKGARLGADRALLSLSYEQLDAVLYSSITSHSASEVQLSSGAISCKGAAKGFIANSVAQAEAFKKEGKPYILNIKETDVTMMTCIKSAQAVITQVGGRCSHAAIVCRQLGIPALIGTGEIQKIADEELVSLDGNNCKLYLGDSKIKVGDPQNKEVLELLGLLEQDLKPKMNVLVNAESEKEIAIAQVLGARGIGVVRTEHMFFEQKAFALVGKAMSGDTAAAGELAKLQEDQFYGILKAMNGFPVTIRLLDAPSHEFPGGNHEQNPMLGLRGPRLEAIKPGLYPIQVQAIVNAHQRLKAEGFNPKPKIMIPMVSDADDFVTCYRQSIVSILETADLKKDIPVGSMLEIPSACLAADAIPADFFSFGTNDLTQTTLGVSRDDCGRWLNTLKHDPFTTVDPAVLKMMQTAVMRSEGKETSVCGEHGADPASIAQFIKIGVNTVSVASSGILKARLAILKNTNPIN